MLINYCKIAFRNLWRNKGFSAINILGLAVGLATCLLITLFVKDELSYDTYNVNADRIYRIDAHFRVDGTVMNERLTPPPLGPAVANEYPQIEKAVRINDHRPVLVKKGRDIISEPNGCFADSTIFSVFTLPMIAGDPATALREPNSMVITDKIAEKYFTGLPVYNVPGKTLVVNKTNYTITGVFKEMPAQSHVHFSLIASMAGKKDSRELAWFDNGFVTYLLARPGVSQQSVDNAVNAVVKKYAEPQLIEGLGTSFADLAKKGDYFKYASIPLTKIHLYSTISREAEPAGSIQYVYIFTVIAIAILLIACVNFMNLSTARSAGRSKEVGIRKVLGSARSSLIYQFLTESVIMALISFLLAMLIVMLVLPYFNSLSGKNITIGIFANAWLIPSLLGGTLIVGLLAGSYPAFFLSSFQPIKVLKGKLATGFKTSFLRNGLVIFQFTTAIILIVSTLVIYSQLHYIRSRDLGYNREQVLILENTAPLGKHAKTFKDQALKIPGVVAATMADVLPTNNETNTDIFFKERTAMANSSIVLESWYVDADYVPAMGMHMSAGRNFSSQMLTDTAAVLINQTAASLLGFKEPIGKIIYEKTEKGVVGRPIIGVVKDFNAGSLRNKIPAIVFTLGDERTHIAFRINTKNTPALIAQLENTFHSTEKMMGQPFVFTFMDEDFNRLYQSEQRTARIFISFALFAILIACLGLFGLVTYAAEQRTKEISIRKVLGASISHIVNILSIDFLKLVGISALIAFPIAWWGMHKWLEDFAYRTDISWWVFAMAAIAALLITMVTVGFRAMKAALANPVDSLRAE